MRRYAKVSIFLIGFFLLISCGGGSVESNNNEKNDIYEAQTKDQNQMETNITPDISNIKDINILPDNAMDSSFFIDFEDTETNYLPDFETKSDTEVEWCKETGWFGCECNDNSDCLSGYCVPYKTGKICTQYCEDSCPPDFVCKEVNSDIDPVWICVYKYANSCKPCENNSDCVDFSEEKEDIKCISFGNNGSFCGYACTDNNDCPSGYECKEKTTKEGEVGNFCVPANEKECECTPYFAKEGFETECAIENEWGKCVGIRKCVENEAGEYVLSPCDAKEPKQEECNNKDDNCNGEIDENLVPPEGVCKSDGVCAEGTKIECINGEWKCFYDEVANYEIGEEKSCDGLDNDCDGETDEDFDLQLKDGTIVSGVGVPCGLGECAGGETVCNETQDGIVCSTDNLATQEKCDGKDNDCDGETDEKDDLELAPCENQEGACMGAVHSAFECQNGVWQECTSEDYKNNNSSYEEKETTCDGIDNDCDGGTDNNFSLTLPDGSTVYGVGTSCGTGVCAGGVTMCSEDKTGIVCSTTDKATEEICDNLDNDCDGLTDEGCDDDGDGFCDSNMSVVFTSGNPPEICPNSKDLSTGFGDDCDDENSNIPSCENKECGDNGCGNLCGTCENQFYCDNGKCVPDTYFLEELHPISVDGKKVYDDVYFIEAEINANKSIYKMSDGEFLLEN